MGARDSVKEEELSKVGNPSNDEQGCRFVRIVAIHRITANAIVMASPTSKNTMLSNQQTTTMVLELRKPS